ncbi:MAG: hypothetical protein GVY27_05105 [Deinococcus-Thermus bacterium]|jgi:thymidine phosphorylase|nr:hypothetical protein [Deinococcota bacterium]
MILRLAGNAAVHAAGGVVFGVTAALAACTVAQAGVVAAKRLSRSRQDTGGSSDPFPPPPGSGAP